MTYSLSAWTASSAATAPTAWQLLIDGPRPGAENMARDQAMLDLAERDGTAVLRLYQWLPHCISFGRNEPALRRYDRGRIEQLGLDTVRRPTGGRAVWHARELTYSVTAPLALFGSLADAYRRIHSILAQAVRSLGAAPALAAPPSSPAPLDAGACFASPAGGEVMVLDRKVIGSAQLSQGRAFLQHGSILLDDNQELLTRVTRGTPAPSLDTPLSTLLRRQVSVEELSHAICAHWSPSLTASSAPTALSALTAHYLPHFAAASWTWRR